MGPSDRDRAYLMALGAWKTFGHSREDPHAFARRIAAVGESKGVQSAAEAVAEDCRKRGLEMSASRVLKSLAHHLERHADVIAQPGAVERMGIEDVNRLPPAVERLFNEEKAASTRSPVPWILLIIAAAAIAWYWFG